MLDRERSLRLIADRIKKVRGALRLNQEQLAVRLGLDQSTISKWERYRAFPTPDALIRMASLSDGVDKLFFLEHAGLPAQFLEGAPMITEIQEASAKVVKRALNKEDVSPAWIPLLKDSVAAGEPRAIQERDVDEWIPFSKRHVPGGKDIRALRVSGDSMSPIIDDGYIVFIDAGQRDPRLLAGKMVAARDREGITIKWLRRDKDAFLLVPQHVSQRIPVRIMRPEDDWAIVGVVLMWIGQPAPARK